MKRIGIYIRVSTEEQARIQDGSMVSQRQRLIEYVDGQNRRAPGWGTIIEFYCEEGKSGKDMNRPEFRRMLQDVRLGRIDLILATELSRLSRSLKDFCEVWDLFKKHSTGFITLREQFDTTTAAGEMMVFNLINFAQYERKQTAERISANWQSRAKRGLFNGGTIPLGYERNPKNKSELLVNDEDAKRAQMIFDLFLQEESLRKTCVALKERGVYQKRYINKHGIEKGGRPFSVDTLRSMLTNAAYIGLRPVKAEGEVQLIPAVWKPIISKEMFDKVQSRLGLNKNRYKPDTWKKYPFPLTELVTCGECGKHMGGKSGTGRIQKHFYYGHSQPKDPTKKVSGISCQVKNVRAGRLEEIILKCLKAVLGDQSLLERWIQIYREQNLNAQPEVHAELKRLDAEYNSLSRKIANLVHRVAELPPDIPADSFYEQIRAVTTKRDQIALAREKAKDRVRSSSSLDIDQDRLLARLSAAVERLEQVPKEQQRPIYKEIIHNVEIHPMKLKIELYAPTKPVTEHDGAEKQKATGTDGLRVNLKKSDARVLPFDPSRRAGSSTVGSGAPGQT